MQPDHIVDLGLEFRVGGELTVSARQGCTRYCRQAGTTVADDVDVAEVAARTEGLDELRTRIACQSGSRPKRALARRPPRNASSSASDPVRRTPATVVVCE